MLLKPNTLVYVRRDNLIIGGKHIAAVKLKFAPTLISNLEVLDQGVFTETCQEFFSTHGVNNKRVLLVLDRSVVFSKTVKLDSSDKELAARATQAFIEAMPFEPGQRASVQLREENQLQLFATNADLYITLREALHRGGMRKLIAITPSDLYHLDFNAKPSAVIEQFLEDSVVCKKADFSSVTPL